MKQALKAIQRQRQRRPGPTAALTIKRKYNRTLKTVDQLLAELDRDPDKDKAKLLLLETAKLNLILYQLGGTATKEEILYGFTIDTKQEG